ncbi:MAG: TIGR01212 family radical SAM protein [Erysipelotrichaceae bacterium]|nr:TIGR01212 family radical SAM protein [Erysipelotrichaceae bacterium]MBR5754980.1 TIGR01212 family radical SAM protein [Erysipelotrichaceae bacterium]
MENPFRYSFNEKRYHTYNYYLKTRYGCKVSKVILDAGFTCPNRDGTKAYGGCIFCSARGSGDSNSYSSDDLLVQYRKNKEIMDGKWPNGLYIPYFQAYTNTYGPLEKIEGMLEPFMKMDEVAEIAIATRCDCLPDETISYLNGLTKIKPIWLEIGLQSSSDKTGEAINRQYSFEDFKDALYRLEKTDIDVCVHVMNGLPQETIEDMLDTIKDISHLPFEGIKIHMLHIIRDTAMAKMHEEKPFNLITREQYIELVVRQLELLRPEVVVERLTGDPLKEDLIEPEWVLNKTTILNDIDKLMRKLDTWQGKSYE